MLISATVLLDAVQSAVPAIILFGSSVPYFAAEVAVIVACSVLPRRFYIRIDDAMYSMYQRLVLFFFEQMSGVKLVLYGDIDELLARKENVLYISNHQCAVDWVVADMLAVRQGSLGYIRYMLKQELQWIPLFGWYFYQHGCVYVRRKGAFRQDITTRQLQYLAQSEIPFWLILFPEGTRFNTTKPHIRVESQEFAKKKGLVPLEQHNFPRTRGLQLILSHARNRLDAIYDVTAVYSETRINNGERMDAPGMFTFVRSRPGTELHVNIKRIPIARVPEDEAGLESWLYERFQEKDRYLRQYYSPSYVSGTPIFPDLKVANSILPCAETLPSTFVLGGSFLLSMMTEFGRFWYWRLALFGTLGAYGWMKVRRAA